MIPTCWSRWCSPEQEAEHRGVTSAINMSAYVRGEVLPGIADEGMPPVKKPPREGARKLQRQDPGFAPAGERRRSFMEIKSGLDAHGAAMEAQRCMVCGSKADIAYPEDCQVCYMCTVYCPTGSIEVTPDKCIKPMTSWR